MFRKFTVRLSKTLRTPDGTAVAISCRFGAAWLEQASLEDLKSVAQTALAICSEAVNQQLDRQLAAGRQAPPEHGNGRSAAELLEQVRHFVGRMKDFNEDKLARLVRRMFHRPLDQLSRLEAKCLLDTLAAIESRGIDPDSISAPDFS